MDSGGRNSAARAHIVDIVATPRRTRSDALRRHAACDASRHLLQSAHSSIRVFLFLKKVAIDPSAQCKIGERDGGMIRRIERREHGGSLRGINKGGFLDQ